MRICWTVGPVGAKAWRLAFPVLRGLQPQMVPEVNQQSPIRIAEMVGVWCRPVEAENLFAPRHWTPESNHISGAGSIAVEIEQLDDLARTIFDLIQTDRVRVEPHLVNQHDARGAPEDTPRPDERG